MSNKKTIEEKKECLRDELCYLGIKIFIIVNFYHKFDQFILFRIYILSDVFALN
jgi:hypothetical protein